MFTHIHQLPLPAMFAVCLMISLAVCWCVIGAVRTVVRVSGFDLSEMLPIKDSIIGACTTIFALIVAFSAAGIWNDALTARNAVQRETDSLENALVLISGLPTEVQDEVRANVRAYVAGVTGTDWPAMRRGVIFDDPVFERSEKILVDTIDQLARRQASLGSLPTFVPLLNQLLEARHARLARLAASNSGVTWAQWIAMLVISTTALTAIAVCNCHSFGMQITATHLYAVVAAAAYFVILAHDRPFIGKIAIQPTAFSVLATQ